MPPVVLYLEPLPDPLERSHGVRRSPHYRLKGLLKDLQRQYGWRVRDYAQVRPETPSWADGGGI